MNADEIERLRREVQSELEQMTRDQMCEDEHNWVRLDRVLSRLDALEAEVAKSKDAVRLALKLAMREFSEHYYCAGWNSGLDELIASNDCEDAKSIRALADLCGGWWRWDYKVERECFVPMDEWRKLAALAPSDSSGARKETQ